MKIRDGFVSNSSSSSFIIQTKDNNRISMTKFISELVMEIKNIIENKKDKYSSVMPIDIALKKLDDEIHSTVCTTNEDCMYGLKFEGGKRRYIYPHHTHSGYVTDYCGSISWIIRAVLREEKTIEFDDFVIKMDEEWY